MPMPPVKQPSASTASSAPTESVEARIARSMDSSLQTSGRVTFVTMKADEPASVGAPPVALAPAPARKFPHLCSAVCGDVHNCVQEFAVIVD